MKQARASAHGYYPLLRALKKRIEENLTSSRWTQPWHSRRADSFGLKFATHYAAFVRARERLVAAHKDISTCRSQAVAHFNRDPRIKRM